MKESLEKCWKSVIENYFRNGHISYERQLQAHLFYELKNELRDHLIWIEPYMFIELKHELDGTKPDMMITNSNREILCVMELKCQPWTNVMWERDIEKLQAFEQLKDSGRSIPLNWYPVSSNWNEQKKLEPEKPYFFDGDCVFAFGVIGKMNCSAVEKLDVNINNFLHLTHWVEKWD